MEGLPGVLGNKGTREHDHLLLGNKGYLKITFREQGKCCVIIGNKGTLIS